jgi:hypothetical protein
MADVSDWRLYWSPMSSAALRVVLALRAKGVSPANMPICVANRAGGDGNAYLVEAEGGSGEMVEYRTISPEGCIADGGGHVILGYRRRSSVSTVGRGVI